MKRDGLRGIQAETAPSALSIRGLRRGAVTGLACLTVTVLCVMYQDAARTRISLPRAASAVSSGQSRSSADVVLSRVLRALVAEDFALIADLHLDHDEMNALRHHRAEPPMSAKEFTRERDRRKDQFAAIAQRLRTPRFLSISAEYDGAGALEGAARWVRLRLVTEDGAEHCIELGEAVLWDGQWRFTRAPWLAKCPGSKP